MKRLRSSSERGQTIVFFVVALVVLVGMAAFVLDVGSWWRADRHAQTMADAAALAGAQALPNAATAKALAEQYADQNGGSGAVKTVAFASAVTANDTISVDIEQPAPGFFAKLFGLNSVTVHSRATARTGNVDAVKYVAPMVVSKDHPLLQCNPQKPCPGNVSLPYWTNPDETPAPGAFGMLNLNRSSTGTVGSSTMADWISNGYQDYLGKGWYDSDPGAKFSAGVVRAALDSRIGTELYFPVFQPPMVRQGSNAKYNIIGWVAFHLTSYDIRGNNATLYGYFTGDYVEGLQATSGGNPDFGLRDIDLIE